MCRVWFCLIGPKNTREATWDAPESAFKMMVARDPNKPHTQSTEYTKNKGAHAIYYHSTPTLTMRMVGDLEAKTDKILENLFLGNSTRNIKIAN